MKITANMKRYADRRNMEIELVEDDEDFGCDVVRIWHFDEGDMGEPVVQYRVNDDSSLGFLPFSDQRGEDWPAHINDWVMLKQVINYANKVASED